MNVVGIIGTISRIREQANLLIERELRERKIEGILPAHGAVLNFLFRQNQPVPIKRVVEQVRRVKSTVTGILNTMEQYGYIRKMPSEKDNRVTLIELTEKGNLLRGDFEEISMILLKQVYGNMSESDRNHLVNLLGRVEVNLKR